MAKSLLPSALLFLVLSLLAVINLTEAQIGVCYGMLGDNLPSRQEVVNMYEQYGIRRMRLYGPDGAAFQALDGSQIELILDVPYQNLPDLAQNLSSATAWVHDNIINHPGVNFKYIAVGNEIMADDSNAKFVVPAMRNVQTEITNAGLSGQIKVSTAIRFDMLTDTYPPSKATFNLNQDSLVTPIIDFLLENQAPLLANIYPYFAYSGNTAQVALNYALFTAKDSVVNDGQLNYQNLFDAMLDSVYNALEKKNAGSVKVVVSESGWPTGGGVGASVDNAETYNSKLVRHVKGGTPKRQNQAIETYIFAMFDENQKTGDPVERFWGLFQPVQKKLKYAMEFS